MKKTGILIVLIFQAMLTTAQSNNNHLSASFGPSFPTGKYAGTDFFGDGTGMASPGFSAMLSFNHKINNIFGYQIAGYLQSNTWDRKRIAAQLGTTGFPFGPGTTQRYYSNWEVQKSKWQVAALMAGIFAELPLSQAADNKFTFRPKVMAGISHVWLPSVFADSKADTAYALLTSGKGNAFAPALMLGAELNYQITSRLSIFLLADFFGTNHARFKDVELSVYATNGGLVIPDQYSIQNSRNTPVGLESKADQKQTFSGLNTRIGLSFGF